MASEVITESPDVAQESHWTSPRLRLGNDLAVQVIAGTAAAGERNEDAFAVHYSPEGLYVAVFDGATSLEPLPNLPDGVSGARLASHFLRRKLHEIVAASPEISPHDLMLRLNSAMLPELVKFGMDVEDKDRRPGSTATILHIGHSATAQFAHVGDGIGWTQAIDGSSSIFTEDRNARFDKAVLGLIGDLVFEGGMSPKEARAHEDVITALKEARRYKDNRPDGTGTGILNGDEHVALYIQSGEMSLDALEALLATSDGLLPSLLDPEREESRNMVYKYLQLDGNFAGVIRRTRAIEDSDPDLWNLRLKPSDDATGTAVVLL